MKAEGIEVNPEEFETNLVDMAKKYDMELEKLKELIPEAEMESMKKDIQKAGDCKRLHEISECSPTCTAGYDFMMDGVGKLNRRLSLKK